jgi:hypothetical protein
LRPNALQPILDLAAIAYRPAAIEKGKNFMKSLLIMTTGIALLAAAAGSASAETLTASFLNPDGGLRSIHTKGSWM